MSDPTVPSPPPAPTEVSYEQALHTAQQLHRGGQLQPAERLYRILREAAPHDPNPTHYLGVLLHQSGRGAEGADLIRQSIEVDPTVASWHNNLGNVLLDSGDLEGAAQAYQRCIDLDDGNVEVLNNLGVMLRDLKRYDEAEAVLKRALEKSPQFANARTNLASLYFEQRRIKEGLEHIAQVMAAAPNDPIAQKMLGLLYASLGRLDEAAKVFQQWLAREPDNEQAKHHLAACTSAAPERASVGYVEQVFDAFAGSFDAKLTSLEYRAPEIIGQAVTELLGAQAKKLKIIDAGCGTGLCAPYLAPYAQTLIGVDLSENMLSRARVRGGYQALTRSDLVLYLATLDAAADLIVSADTLCYFGKLNDVFIACQKALVLGGLLIFTAEAHDREQDYHLNPHGRYSHRASYLKSALREAAFELVLMKDVHLRNEGGQPVNGWVIAAKKRSTQSISGCD